MAKNKHLFGDTIEPACVYCANGSASPGDKMIICKKFGPVAPHYKCKKFEYNPLKRIPPRRAKLPVFSPEDFEIDP